MDTSVLIPYLSAIVNEDEQYFEDPDNLKDVQYLLRQPLDEWDVLAVDPVVITELFELSALIQNINEILNDTITTNKFISEFYTPYFSFTFFDADPMASLSVAGWINYNFARQMDEQDGHQPSQSFHGIHDFIHELVEASPTRDESLPENIESRIAEMTEQSDDEALEEYFFTELNDQCYTLSKLLNIHGTLLIQTVEFGTTGAITEDVVVDIVDRLNDLVNNIRSSFKDGEQDYHAVTILDNSVARLRDYINDLLES